MRASGWYRLVGDFVQKLEVPPNNKKEFPLRDAKGSFPSAAPSSRRHPCPTILRWRRPSVHPRTSASSPPRAFATTSASLAATRSSATSRRSTWTAVARSTRRSGPRASSRWASSDATQEEADAVFDWLDSDGSGSIPYKELDLRLRRSEPPVTDLEKRRRLAKEGSQGGGGDYSARPDGGGDRGGRACDDRRGE